MKRLSLLLILSVVIALATPVLAARYSYENCVTAVMLWCRHNSPFTEDRMRCVGMSARQCADCVTMRQLKAMRGEQDALGFCRQWLDGTIVRDLRRSKRSTRGAHP